MIAYALSIAQAGIGLAIVLAGVLLLATAVDRRTAPLVRWPMVGLIAWGAWFALVPAVQGPDSPPSLAMAALVAFVLILRRRAVLACLGLSTRN